MEEANEAEIGLVPQPQFRAAEEAMRRRTVIPRLVPFPLVPPLRLPLPRVRFAKGFVFFLVLGLKKVKHI